MKTMILPFLLAAIISFVATPPVRKWAIKHGFMDIPKDERRVHKKAIPLSGGLAIYLATIVGVLVFLPLDSENIAYIIGASLIAFAGLYDDKYDLSPSYKFGIQIMAAVVLIVGGVKISFFTNPFYGANLLVNLEWLAIPITIFWVVGITNTINLIDGLDGLACGISALSLIHI